MTNEERAKELANKFDNMTNRYDQNLDIALATKMLLAYADEIRAEAAEKAWDYIELKAKHPKFGMELSKRELRLAVTGKDTL